MQHEVCLTWNIALKRADCAIRTILCACILTSPAFTVMSHVEASSKYGPNASNIHGLGNVASPLSLLSSYRHSEGERKTNSRRYWCRKTPTAAIALMCTPNTSSCFFTKPLSVSNNTSDESMSTLPQPCFVKTRFISALAAQELNV